MDKELREPADRTEAATGLPAMVQAGPVRKSVPRQLSVLASLVLEPVIARRAGMTIDLVAAWRELVGPRHADYTRPERIIWPRRVHEDDPFRPGTLLVACDGGRAIWLQHEAGEIVERVNVFFGFPAIERIRITQKPIARLEPKRSPVRPQLDSRARQRIDAILADIEEGPLRDSLKRLGEGVFGRARNDRSSG